MTDARASEARANDASAHDARAADAHAHGARVLMVVGTGSHAGKSVLAAGAVPHLRSARLPRRALQGAEHGAQLLRHARTAARSAARRPTRPRAAGVEPHVDMNPVLLKPSSQTGSQVIVLGRPVAAHVGARVPRLPGRGLADRHGRVRATAGGQRPRRHRGRGQPGRDQSARPRHRQHEHRAPRRTARCCLSATSTAAACSPRWSGTWSCFTPAGACPHQGLHHQQVPRRRRPARLRSRLSARAHRRARPWAWCPC